MDRRTFTKMLAGLMTASALPTTLQAKTPLGDQESFLKALEEKPWLLGYLGTRETELGARHCFGKRSSRPARLLFSQRPRAP